MTAPWKCVILNLRCVILSGASRSFIARRAVEGPANCSQRQIIVLWIKHFFHAIPAAIVDIPLTHRRIVVQLRIPRQLHRHGSILLQPILVDRGLPSFVLYPRVQFHLTPKPPQRGNPADSVSESAKHTALSGKTLAAER